MSEHYCSATTEDDPELWRDTCGKTAQAYIAYEYHAPGDPKSYMDRRWFCAEHYASLLPEPSMIKHCEHILFIDQEPMIDGIGGWQRLFRCGALAHFQTRYGAWLCQEHWDEHMKN